MCGEDGAEIGGWLTAGIRHGLDALAPSAATIQYLDQAIEHIARSYLTAEPAELTDEIRVTIAAQACLLLLHRETDYYRFTVALFNVPEVAQKAADIHCQPNSGPEPFGLAFVASGVARRAMSAGSRG